MGAGDGGVFSGMAPGLRRFAGGGQPAAHETGDGRRSWRPAPSPPKGCGRGRPEDAARSFGWRAGGGLASSRTHASATRSPAGGACASSTGSPDKRSGFSKAYGKGYSLLKSSLRRKQIQVAMSGNTTMLIWLGKQILRQSDKHQVRGPDEVDIAAIHAEADAMTVEEAQARLARRRGRAPLYYRTYDDDEEDDEQEDEDG